MERVLLFLLQSAIQISNNTGNPAIRAVVTNIIVIDNTIRVAWFITSSIQLLE
jgi:hypothetical protein